jgi:hypothetical protein
MAPSSEAILSDSETELVEAVARVNPPCMGR